MIPEYPNFKKLGFEDIELLSRCLRHAETSICELNIANILIWKDFDKAKITLINKNPCMLLSPENEPPYFLPPLGDNNLIETVAVCMKHIGKISRAEEHFIRKLAGYPYHIKCLRNQFDYIYRTRDMAELKGRKFDGKRNQIKQFKSRFPEYEFTKATPDLKKDALGLFEKWFDIRRESRHFPKLAHDSQKKAINLAFSNYESLDLTGGALSAEGSLKGFILGSPINKGTVSVHFSYGDPSVRGTSQMLFHEAANKVFSSFEFMNLEQDLGIPGLRRSKLSYHPLKLEKKFEIRPST